MNTESRIQNWTQPMTLGEYAAQSAGGGNPDEPVPCTNCGSTFAPGGKCHNCGKVNPAAAGRQQKKRRRPEVFADKCPHCSSDDTYVNSTRANGIRWCYCRTCEGDAWKQTA